MASAPPRESKLTVGGLHSPLLQAGPPDASEAVVFVHGNPGSSQDWKELLSRSGEFARAVAFDMPGYGRADKPANFDYTIGGYAAFFNSALEALDIRRAHLVVHDFGGPFGLTWAAAHPDALVSVVIINSGVLIDYRWHYLARIWRTPLLGELFMATATRPAFRLLLRHGNPRRLPREFVDRSYDDFDRDTRRTVLKLYRATPPEELARPAPKLRELDIPALVVWGTGDPYIPRVQAERQRKTFPNAEIIFLENSGHWPFIDAPERVAEVVLPFLRSQVRQNLPSSAPERDPAPPDLAK